MALRRSDILRLLDRMEVLLDDAFFEAVLQIRSRAQMRQLVAALDAGDIDAAFRSAGMRPGSWTTLTESVRNVYQASGAAVMAADVPARFGAMFDISNPRAEVWISKHSSELITKINADTRASIQTILENGLRAGRGSNSTALDIVGRISKQTGRRTGGIIGLSDPQTKYVAEMRKALSGPLPVGVSGINPAGKPVKKFWIGNNGDLQSKYTLRDKRFDGTIKKAIQAGEKLADADVNRLAGRYSDRLLEARGKTVARTEAQNALHQAAEEAMNQVVDGGWARAEDIIGKWDAFSDLKTRSGHLAMDGQERQHGTPFNNPVTGAFLMHPGDSELGAGPEDIVNCRCVKIRKVNFAAIEMAR